jgi:hypothetical protein
MAGELVAYRMAATRRPMVEGRMPRSTSHARKAATDSPVAGRALTLRMAHQASNIAKSLWHSKFCLHRADRGAGTALKSAAQVPTSELIEELRHYHQDENFKIVKQRDDLVSALRYAVMMRRSGKLRSECDGIGFGNMPFAGQRADRSGEPQLAKGLDFDVFTGR